MNNLFQQLNQNQSLSLPSNVKQMINMLKGMQNPQAMAQKMLSENPQLQTAIKMAGGNPEQAFKTLAKQMNVNPDEIMNMLK